MRIRRFVSAASGRRSPRPRNSCVDCHTALDGRPRSRRIHARSTSIRRTGSAAPTATAATPTPTTPKPSMSRANGFTGKIARTAVPKLCARCHSDANLMHRYKPQQRVDQLAQYQTSVHGKRWRPATTRWPTAWTATACTTSARCATRSRPCIRCGCRRPARAATPTRRTWRSTRSRPTQFDEYRTERALGGAGQARRPVGAHLRLLPRQPRSDAAAGQLRGRGLRHLPRAVRGPVQEEPSPAGVRRDGSRRVHRLPRQSQDREAVRRPCLPATRACAPSATTRIRRAARPPSRSATGSRNWMRRWTARRRSSNGHGSSGMEVSEAQIQLRTAARTLVKARVAVHAFQTAAVAKPVQDGLAIAAQDVRGRSGGAEGTGLPALRPVHFPGRHPDHHGRPVAGDPVDREPSRKAFRDRWELIHVFRFVLARRRAAPCPLPAPESSRSAAPSSAAAAIAPSTKPGRVSSHAHAMESRLFQDALESAEVGIRRRRSQDLPELPCADCGSDRRPRRSRKK